MFDGTKKTFEKIKRPDSVTVIPITQDGKFIITSQSQPGKKPFISVAGGRAEEGENPEEVAKRELLEETGYQTDNLTLWFAVQPVSKIDWTEYTFIAKNCQKVKEPELDSGEQIEVKLDSFDEFIENVLDEDFQDKEIVMKVVRAKLDPEKTRELKEFFFS